MILIRIVLVFLVAFPAALHAQAVASQPQTREWMEKSPPNGFTITNHDTYVDYKRSKEVEAVRARPHPYEFALYYDI